MLGEFVYIHSIYGVLCLSPGNLTIFSTYHLSLRNWVLGGRGLGIIVHVHLQIQNFKGSTW